MGVHPTVTASTMIAQVCERHKVRCHKGAAEILGASAVLNVDRAGRWNVKIPAELSLPNPAKLTAPDLRCAPS